MKTAQLEINGDSILEVIMVLNPKEVKLITEGLYLLAKSKPRSKIIKKFVDEFELNNMFL